jgi:hypothetical protein
MRSSRTCAADTTNWPSTLTPTTDSQHPSRNSRDHLSSTHAAADRAHLSLNATAPMWAPQVPIRSTIPVGTIGFAGIIVSQLIDTWRGDGQWKREQEREDLRWNRESQREEINQSIANRTQWRDRTFGICTGLPALRRAKGRYRHRRQESARATVWAKVGSCNIPPRQRDGTACRTAASHGRSLGSGRDGGVGDPAHVDSTLSHDV